MAIIIGENATYNTANYATDNLAVQTALNNNKSLRLIGDFLFTAGVLVNSDTYIFFEAGSIKPNITRPNVIDRYFNITGIDNIELKSTKAFVFDGLIRNLGHTSNPGSGFLNESFFVIDGVNNVRVEGVNIVDGHSSPINIRNNCSYINVSNCYINETAGDSAIDISTSTGTSVIVNNNIVINSSGIKINTIDNVVITNNIIRPQRGGEIVPTVEYTDWGININQCSSGIISGNEITDCRNDLSNLSYGIQVNASSSININNNVISENQGVAILINSSNHNIINNNNLVNNGKLNSSTYKHPITLIDSNYNTIRNNHIVQTTQFQTHPIRINSNSSNNRSLDNSFGFYSNRILNEGSNNTVW